MTLGAMCISLRLESKVGDRVPALHELGSSGGNFAEYALVWDWTIFHICNNISFEAAAAVSMGVGDRLEAGSELADSIG